MGDNKVDLFLLGGYIGTNKQLLENGGLYYQRQLATLLSLALRYNVWWEQYTTVGGVNCLFWAIYLVHPS